MKFKNWINYKFPSAEIIHGASNSKYVERSGRIEGDIPQIHPVGIAPQSNFKVFINSLEGFNYKNVNQKLCHHGHVKHRRPHSIGLKRRRKSMENFFSYDFVTFDGDPKSESMVNFSKYLSNFLEHKFIFSPEGNGVDCHRHYEILLCKGIPILQEPNEKYCKKRWGLPCYIKEKYKDLPVIFTDSFRGLSGEFLEKKYKEILDTDFNFDKLKLSFWEPMSNIKEDCEYWQKKYKSKGVE